MKQKMLIFRTSAKRKRDIKLVANALSTFKSIKCWNVDLEDWEKVLRIECETIAPEEISSALRNVGIFASELI
ncbi:MAG: hypothetical protein LBC98_03950 [Prevotellaceae bacterium]|jgi:hypothetical protein|nr:hypothetical protein [Prevotellaceae bacterium]